MKKITILILIFVTCNIASAYDYLLSDNWGGGFYGVDTVKMPETINVAKYWYDPNAGGIASSVFPDSPVLRKLTDGDGANSDSEIWGPWDGNKRIDVVFDLGKAFKINKVELRTWGRNSGIAGDNGVAEMTVRASVNNKSITQGLDSWNLIGTSTTFAIDYAPNYLSKHDPSTNAIIPVPGRYVWFEIHGLNHQVQVAELAVWGEFLGYPSTCAEVLMYGQGNLSDINKDCKVDFTDFAKLAQDWLKCNKPGDTGCELVW
jgi:hypothetical protein